MPPVPDYTGPDGLCTTRGGSFGGGRTIVISQPRRQSPPGRRPVELPQAGSAYTDLRFPAIATVDINFASTVIAALRTLETGQSFSASPTIRVKAASSRFGTWARTVRADRLMRNPSPSGSMVTAASTSSAAGE